MQERHLSSDADHEEKMAGPGWGKQQPERAAPDPRPGSVANREGATTTTAPAGAPAHPGASSEPGELGEDEQRVFEAVVRRELDHGAASASDLADDVGLSPPDTEVVLRRLVDHHDVIQQLPGETNGEDFGPRYRAKTRV